MKYLITSSLLNSYDYLRTCPNEQVEKSLDDFIGMIKRERKPTTEACQRGIEFERLICDNFGKTSDEYRELVTDLYARELTGEKLVNAINVTCDMFEACKGGNQQVPVMKDIEIEKMQFHLFGYADIVFPNKIIDIKTTGFFKPENYLNSSQHYLYSLCTGIKDFEYYIAVFSGKYPKEIKVISRELQEEECINVLESRIKSLIKFIQKAGLWEDYENTFTALHKDYK